MIRIEGRGPVALALRLLLEREGIDRQALIADPIDADLPDWLGSRALAVSLGSLRRSVEWCRSARPMRSLNRQVWLHQSRWLMSAARASGGTRIRASELGTPLLGAVFRYGTLHRLLRESIELRAPLARPLHDQTASGEQPLLTVIADGEAEQRPGHRTREFEQMALLAEVEVERDCPGWAYERFTSEGPLALLPLPEPRRRALVWCAPQLQCRARAELSEAAFGSALYQTFGPGLGRITLRGTRHVSPVTRRIGPLRPAPDQIAIGNAAQALHPVAGQGLNLGLRDAAVLARVLGDWRAQAGSLAAALDRFENHRRRDRETLVATTDLLATLTGPDLLKPVHAAALTLIDFCAPLRRTIARGLMFGIRSR